MAKTLAAAVAMMLVKNNEARVHNLGDHVILRPGINEVPKDKFEEACEIELVKHYLDEGTIEVVKPTAAATAAAGASPGTTGSAPAVRLQDFKAGEAIALVEETFDLDLLQKWSAEQQSKTVATAIEKQIELINEAGGEAEAQNANS